MTTSYIICATPRSGSTLLCDLLTSTGAGRPASYYRLQSIPRWSERLGVPAGPDFDRDYLDAVLAEGRAGTSVFGLRLMWSTLPELSARLAAIYPPASSDLARLEAAFGHITFIHLSRADKVAQAVSRLKAEQTGLWHLGSDGTERERAAPPAPAQYDPAQIRAYVDELEADERAWTNWFATSGIAPLELSYEALSVDPRATVQTVLARLGLDPSAAEAIAPRTARMADAVSQDWIARFKAEHGA